MIKAVLDTYAPLFTRLNALILLLVALAAAIAGPFGTYETQTFWLRCIYWFLVSGVSLLVGHGCRTLVDTLVPLENPFKSDLLMVALMVVVFTPVLWVITHSVLNHEADGGPTLGMLSFYVATITAGICITRRLLPGFEPVGYFGSRFAAEKDQPRLMRRLSPEFSGPVIRLTVRDHFVDVVSASATETIRMRFADAIDEMDTVVGHCTHRSHWVVETAIVGVERNSGRIHVKLVNGDLVPVSRKYRPGLEEAGLV